MTRRVIHTNGASREGGGSVGRSVGVPVWQGASRGGGSGVGAGGGASVPLSLLQMPRVLEGISTRRATGGAAAALPLARGPRAATVPGIVGNAPAMAPNDGVAPEMTEQQVYELVLTEVAQATSQLQLPPSQPVFGPDPAGNEWGKLAVGLPVWFWTDEQQQVDASRAQNGIAIELLAERGPTTFDFGDGTSLTCDSMTPRPADAQPMVKSPDCGHVYTRHGTYTVTATSAWEVQWSALGFSGTQQMRRSASSTVTVGQLASVVVR